MSKHSPLRTGGIVRVYYPQSIGEFCQIRSLYPDVPVIGALSNTLVFDSVKAAISTTKLSGWEAVGRSGVYRLAAGTKMPAFIHHMAQLGLGGMEYLATVPGTFGGGVFMNAGRGGGLASIGERIERLEVVDSRGKVLTMQAKALNFQYRSCTVLAEDPSLKIVSVDLRLDITTPQLALRRIRERLEHVKTYQDRSRPNLGSVFIDKVRIPHKGLRRGGMTFSQKTANWLLNSDEGTAEQALELLDFVKHEHMKIGHPPPREEICLLR